MFLRDARAAAQLKHPNIVSVHEVGKQDDTVYIVSDFVQGATLKEWTKAKPLTPQEAAGLCAKIAKALHHAHEAGVIHRDLKPGNIMMDTDKLFKDVWKLNFTLLSDEEAQIPKMFGVPVRRGGRVRPRGPDRERLLDANGEPFTLERKSTFIRWTFIIGKDGKIAYKKTKVKPAKDSEQVLEFIRKPAGPPK